MLIVCPTCATTYQIKAGALGEAGRTVRCAGRRNTWFATPGSGVLEEAVPAPVLAASLFARFRSRREATFADKLLSAMRNKFGGHAEAKREAP
jgi:predicted Zn finger-like uncharacterized protein